MSDQVAKLQAENDENRQRALSAARVLAEDFRRLALGIDDAVACEDLKRLADIIPVTFTRAEAVRRAAFSVSSLDDLLARVRMDGPR